MRAIYNNLKTATWAAEGTAKYPVPSDPTLDLAKRIDTKVRSVRPDAWRGVQTREQIIKAALYELLGDVAEVERMFLIVKAQGEY